MADLLDSINSPADLAPLADDEMAQLASEIRRRIIEVVSCNQGHLASNLGAVELTLALHAEFDFARDKLVWDCGHQTYTHKILTGRRDRFSTLRQEGGITGYADKNECPEWDSFSFGHTATSISTALGLACAREHGADDDWVVAVIGDGAMASGMAFEAMNHAGALDRRLLVVLNDNRMSISRSVGAFAQYFSKLRASTSYTGLRDEIRDLVGRLPVVGETIDSLADRLSGGIQAALTPGGLFVELGFGYYGPINGHRIGQLRDTIRHLKRMKGPVLLHLLTEKGRGFAPAVDDPTRFHSAGRFEWEDDTVSSEEPSSGTSYSSVFGAELCRQATADKRIVAITAAMPGGTGLLDFGEKFRDRLHDVGICEQHATGFAAGLCAGGLRPVFAVYSTFLQRAFDQMFHEVSLQRLPVVFCVDRAGLVGSDGPTHHGLLDIAMGRSLPGFVLMAPSCAADLRRMMQLALAGDSPAMIRYPRESVPDEDEPGAATFDMGQAGVLRRGPDGAIIAYGIAAIRASAAAAIMAETDGLEITVVDARFARPLDTSVIFDVVRNSPAVLLAEDHCIAGGFGSEVLEQLVAAGMDTRHVRQVGVPREFILHAAREVQLSNCGLDAEGLAERLRGLLAETRSDT
jgi:1-deoxy-D-xylulose-5-phosphate synthase